MKTIDTRSVALLVLAPVLGSAPLGCGGEGSNSGTNAVTQSTGGVASVGSNPPPSGWAPTGGASFATGGGSGASDPVGAAGANPDYQEIPYTRCVPEFCPPVEGAEACCESPNGPCGADYGDGWCRSPEPVWGGNGGTGNGGSNSGTGGRWWWNNGGNGGGGSGGTGGATDPADASTPLLDAGQSDAGQSDAATVDPADAAGD